jgi:putative copper export protein/mono/diheme cytochrome c family protein
VIVPDFTVEGGAALVLSRALAVAALCGGFGVTSVWWYVVPRALRGTAPAEQAAARRLMRRMAVVCPVLALAALGLWLAIQAAVMAESGSTRQALLAVLVVLRHSRFGEIWLGQAIASVLLLGAARAGWARAALICAGAALLLQAGHSHAVSMHGWLSWPALADGVHLLGAGAWLGGLPPLLLLVRAFPPRTGALAARWFSPLGKLCVAAMLATAALQGWLLIGGVPGLAGTAYGWVALGKAALLAALLGFAVVNRYRLAPALLKQGGAAKPALLRSLALQTITGLAVLAAAAWLSSLPPAIHTQPDWPFPDRFSLDTVQEDAGFRTEVVGAACVAVAGLLLVLTGAALRHWQRWSVLALGGAAFWFAVPHLSILFVPAYPTSFYRSPTGFAASGIAQGAALFQAHCAACHGAEGHGDGPQAAGLPVPPADLTAAHLWAHSDGELFWWLSHGIEAPEGGLAMPGFASTLSGDERWRLIDYVRAHNAGVARHGGGAWPEALRVPDFPIRCHSAITSMAQLQGGAVRIVIGPAVAVKGVTTVLLTDDPAAKPQDGLCVAAAKETVPAFAILSGLEPRRLPGTQFLADRYGWLRDLEAGDAIPNWNDQNVLAAALNRIEQMPDAAPPQLCHVHAPL